MKTNRANASYATPKSTASYSGSKASKSLRSQNQSSKKKQSCNTFQDHSLKLLKSQFMLEDSGNPGPSEETPSDETPPPPKPSWRQSTKDTINQGVDKVFDVLDDGKAKCDEVINGAKQKIVETGKKIIESIEKL